MRRAIHLLTLQCVLVIAEEGSILGASQRLNIHHTALSRRIRDLEAMLGITLFERHPGGTRPTIAGLRFLSDLRPVLTDLDNTLSLVHRSGRGETGQLSIGLDAPLPAFGYLDAVVAFIRDKPDVDIRFTEAPRAELRARLGSRAVDVIIAHGFDGIRSGESLYLWRDPIVVGMSAGHPLAGRAEIDWAELAQETILANLQSVDVATLRGVGAGAPLPSVIRHDVSRLSLLNLVRKELGVTLLPKCDAANLAAGVVSAALRCDGKPLRLRYDAHWRKNNSNPVLAAFVTFLRKDFPES